MQMRIEARRLARGWCGAVRLTGYLQNVFHRHYRGALPVRAAPSLDAAAVGVEPPWIFVRSR